MSLCYIKNTVVYFLSCQWMTAGRGVIHAEMPVSDGRIHGIQLWVNLKSVDKMVEPQYQELKGKDIPKPSKDGVTVTVISGEALGVKVGGVFTTTDTTNCLFLNTVQTLPHVGKAGSNLAMSCPNPVSWIIFHPFFCLFLYNSKTDNIRLFTGLLWWS